MDVIAAGFSQQAMSDDKYQMILPDSTILS